MVFYVNNTAVKEGRIGWYTERHKQQKRATAAITVLPFAES